MKFLELAKMLKEKEENQNALLFIKCGAFFVAIEKDAIWLSKNLNFKLTCMTNKICKIGIPINSVYKYIDKLEKMSYSFVIYNYSVVSIMPCVAKKYERQREEMKVDGRLDVDAVMTTRELARMIKQSNIEFTSLEDETFDNPMGEATGAAAIFGTTGGVMEAALRTAYELITGEELKELNFEDVRGAKGIKKATVKIGDIEVKVAVAHGLSNARIVSEEIKNGTADYDFLEVMACPGGCIMGGGQPIKKSKVRATTDIRAKRAEAMYSIDERSTIRKSHENPQMQEIYRTYIGEPGEHRAHVLFHTNYEQKEKYNI